MGVAHKVGQAMCYWLLPSSAIPIARTTIQEISQHELQSEEFKRQLTHFDNGVQEKLKHEHQDTPPLLKLYRQDEDEDDQFEQEPIEPDSLSLDIDEVEADAYDELLLTEPLLPRDGVMTRAKIIGRKRDINDNPVGTFNPNPLLNTRVYLAEYPDGHIQELSANIIADAIYSNMSDDGSEEQMFHDIIDHRQIYEDPDNLHKFTTKGWEISVAWTDGTSSWHKMVEIKNSFPLALAEYAIANNLQDYPAFSWWVHHTIRKKKHAIKAVKSRYSRRTHKFGIYVPQTVQEALELDRQTNTTFWRDAIQKEMKNNRLAFKFLQDKGQVPIGYKWIKCHMIFDVKMDFTRKARYVAGGHMTDPPASITYSSVVSRDSVRIAFLYGLKSSGAAWRAHLANTLRQLGYKSCLADPDVWMRPATKPDGFQYYEYVLVYVDDVLVLSHQAVLTMKALEEFYRLKDGYSEPTRYLGAEIKKWTFPDENARFKWAMSSAQYVKEAIENIELHLVLQDRKLYTSHQPLPTNYVPELDITPLLDDDQTNFYQSQISILRWMIELGRLDIYVHVAQLSSFLVQPRQGHMEAVYCIYGYLKAHSRSTMVFDDTYVNWYDGDFPQPDWTDFYPDVKDDKPHNAPEPRGMPVQINAFVDANHAQNKVTRRSHTGILIYLNRAPVIWHSKAQKTVETSTFGSEFIALKTGTELIKSLRYKLQMMGIPLEGPANVLVDNESVYRNATIPTSTLQKKHNSICYHYVREAVAAGCLRIAHVPSEENLADMFTKPLGAHKLKAFCQRILY